MRFINPILLSLCNEQQEYFEMLSQRRSDEAEGQVIPAKQGLFRTL